MKQTFIYLSLLISLASCGTGKTLEVDLTEEIILGESYPMMIKREQTGFTQTNTSGENPFEYEFTTAGDEKIEFINVNRDETPICRGTELNRQVNLRQTKIMHRSITFRETADGYILIDIECNPTLIKFKADSEHIPLKLLVAEKENPGIQNNVLFTLRRKGALGNQQT